MIEDKDYNKVLDALSDLTIDMSVIVKKINKVPQEVDFDNLENEETNNNEFATIINYFYTFAYNLYTEYYNKNVNSRYVSERFIIIMSLIMETRNRFHIDGTEYKTLQSMLNSLIKTFTKINYDGIY